MTPIERDPSQGLNAEVASVLRAERAAMRNRLTQDELAELADIPVVSLRRYLNAQRHIDVATLASICQAMEINPGDVIATAAARLRFAGKLNEGDVILLPPRAARTFPAVAPEVSEDEDNIEDLYDEPSAAEPQRDDVEGDVDPDLQ